MASKATHPLVGYYFHTFQAPGVVQYQGRIVAVGANPDVVLGHLCSWLTGDPHTFQVFPLRDVFDWKLYQDEEHWREEGARLSHASARLADAQAEA